MTPISVVIVDDEPLAREKLRRLFAADRGFAVVGEAGDGEGAVRVLATTHPMLVCLDIRLPGLSVDNQRAALMVHLRQGGSGYGD